ncbi:hypothetical protein ACFL0O_02345 [Thermodesulfobacteriota bacterium]
MDQPIIIIGMGELGGVFARGFLRIGYPVYPVTREMNILEALKSYPEPLCVLVAVAENDLLDVLSTVPIQWKKKLCLLQNELLPRTWQEYNVDDPTVISVWFEKKKGKGCKVLLPSPVFGPNAALFADALDRLDIPRKILSSENELLFELVLKNVFVFTINIAGLETGGTVHTLWTEHNRLARRIADEIIDLQERLTGSEFSRKRLIDGFVAAIAGDPDHKCTGRAAPERLSRVVKIARDADLDLPGIMEIHKRLNIL